jgi:hypothetical protein
VLIQPITFLVRRLALAMLVVQGADMPFIFQMTFIFASTLAAASLAYVSESFNSTHERRMNTFSEMTILITSYCFLTFKMLDVEANFTIGYVPIGTCSLYIFVSICFLVIGNLKYLKLRIKRYYAIRKYRRWRKLF